MSPEFTWNEVTEVLLIDGWHEVVDGSFSVDRNGYDSTYKRGVEFFFTEEDPIGWKTDLHGPMSAVQALKHASHQ